MNNDTITDIEDRRQSLMTIGHISYFLHTVVAVGAVIPSFQPGIGLLVIAVIMDLVKQGEARGSWPETHFRWRIRSVLMVGALYLITLPLWFLFVLPGWIAWALISVWFLYRIVRGWSNLNARVAMPD